MLTSSSDCIYMCVQTTNVVSSNYMYDRWKLNSERIDETNILLHHCVACRHIISRRTERDTYRYDKGASTEYKKLRWLPA